MRIVPYMPLSTTSTITDNPYWTAVASSEEAIMKSPSPARQTTSLSGKTAFAARAAGTPYPIAPERGASWVGYCENS